jgi:hypothetical protein
MCVNTNPQNRIGCDEERAEYIVDKERANFCEYFALSSRAFDDTKLDKQRLAKAQLAALFGDVAEDNSKSDMSNVKREYEPMGDHTSEFRDQSSTSVLPEYESPAQAAERKLRELLNQ